jgi:uncharacterized protein YcfJ
MNRIKMQVLLALGIASLAATASAQITLYEREGFRGQVFRTQGDVNNFGRTGFNDRASSAIVERGLWEVCEDANFRGRCVVLRRGNYDSLGSIGMSNRISSVRMVNPRQDYEYFAEPVPAPVYEYRRRPSERLREVPVTSVHAVMGPPERRCWVEREQVSEPNVGNNAGGAVVGALIGGILGHQVGGGRGKDAATAAGAIAGAAIGSGANTTTYGRDYERCRQVPSERPAYWDVTYDFRGREYRVQMSHPPGRTVLVNQDGVPRD